MEHYSSPSDALAPSQLAGSEWTHRSGSLESQSRGRASPVNPFLTPYTSQDASRTASATALPSHGLSPRFFHSRRIKKGEVERPWITHKDPREKWVTIIPIMGLVIGLSIAGFLVWDGLRTVVSHEYCEVYVSDFFAGLDESIWTKEVNVGGFGNGQFEQTTNTDENVFIKDGILHIKPTLQSPELVVNDSIIDLRDDGGCVSDIWSNCITSTNTTNGTIIQPVKSGRIHTKTGVRIKYGRVEVEAKLPGGDWLWPAIWMLPMEDRYGTWPQSGEIDIVESRGNNFTYPSGGNNIISSALHWGPTSATDAWWRTNVKRKALHTTYANKFHTFGLEWSEKYLFTYIDTRLLQVLYTNFEEPFWKRGRFPLSDDNGTRLVDPWSQTGNAATPFDQEFYLIINVAVGGTNGWFVDGKNGKPWVDASPTAKRDFWDARGVWLPTWKEGGEMQIKSVKMWQQKGYNNCL